MPEVNWVVEAARVVATAMTARVAAKAAVMREE